MRAEPQRGLDLRYGARPRAALDYFPCGAAKAPLFVFIHGGYWQRNEKERFAFVADGPRAHGINVALPGYTLAPEARLCRHRRGNTTQALTFLAGQPDDLGFDRSRLFVGGWSAGGHLTAAVADHPAVHGGLPISGIFDLEPIALAISTRSSRSAQARSPISARCEPCRSSPPLRLVVGGAELPELQRQSRTSPTRPVRADCPCN